MSTTTTFKRIALVVSVALAFGGVSAVQAQATTTNLYVTCTVADGGTPVDGDVCNGVAGVANTVTLSVADTAKDVLVQVTGTKFVNPEDAAVVIATDGFSATVAGGTSGAKTVKVQTPAVGTYSVKVFIATAGTGIYGATAAETVEITVAASATSGTYSAAKSSVFMASGETNTTQTADATVLGSAVQNLETAVATIKVILKDGLGNGLADTVTATITSGPGYLGQTSDSTTLNKWIGNAAQTADTNTLSAGTDAAVSRVVRTVSTMNNGATGIRADAGVWYFGVFSSNQAGITKVKLTLSDGTVLGEKTITFASTTADKLEAAVKKAFVLGGGTTTNVFAVTVKDSAGNTITTGTVTGTPATGSTVATAAQTATYDTTEKAFMVQAVGAAADKFGAVVYTFKHSSTTVPSTTASVTFSAGVAKTLTITAPATATPGEQVTYTLTAKDANGYAVADQNYELTDATAIFASDAHSAGSFNPFKNGDTITTVNGVATSKVYMPFAAGKITSTWTLAGTAGTASGALASDLTGKVLTTTVTISDSGAAALAAVTDLAAVVKGLRTLIVTLTNLVLKIQKKVKA